MAGVTSVWFSVLVAVFFWQYVAAYTNRTCQLETIMVCDECARCGGTWCNTVDSKPRCMSRDQVESGGCKNPFKPAGKIEKPRNGPKVFEKFIGANTKTSIKLLETYNNPMITFVNTSIKGVTKIEEEMIKLNFAFDDRSELLAIALPGFCPVDGAVEEYMTVRIGDLELGAALEKTVTLAVPCACDCTANAVVNATECNNKGNYTCNVCICEKAWTGKKCEMPAERGDIDENCKTINYELCANRGQCINNKCYCDKTLEGSQYFSETCLSICEIIDDFHDTCVTIPQGPGQCQSDKSQINDRIFIDPTDCSRLNQTDGNGRKVWVACEEQTKNIKYMAMNDTAGITHLMYLDGCEGIVGAQPSTLKVAVPAVLGVLAIVATAAAVAGYMVWKNRTPALPLNNPGYSNIDAEDCIGENPLYKPPTSSFKNPTYGKW